MAERGTAGFRLTKLGRYEVLNELGKGAMGVVYLAKDPLIGRMVAIKTIRASSLGDDDSESREFRERFIREAQTAGILSHPNIVTIHDIGDDGETQTSFIAMEYIEGRNLKSLLAEKNRFTYEQVADIIAEVAEAIDYAHRKGIIHRDIKPANIIMTTDGKVKIMDFGIAKIASSNLTTTGQFLGTPNYMSPEQVSGAPVDGRSDIFSLGVVLYELLTSRKPFQGENLTAISYKIVHEEFTPPADLAPEVPADFNPIVARAMAKDPWNRYQRGKDFALALHQIKARLEEQRALRDLGTMVSAAENMPTLRLENLEPPGVEGSRARRASAAPQPEEDMSDWTEDSGSLSAARVTGARRVGAPGEANTAGSDTNPGIGSPADAGRTVAIPIASYLPAAAPGGPAVSRQASGTIPPRGGSSGWSAASADQPPDSAPLEPAVLAPVPLNPNSPTHPYPASPGADRGAWTAMAGGFSEILRKQDWKKLSRAQLNPRWFWGLGAAVALFVLILLAGLWVRISMVSRSTAPVDAALEKDVRERRVALEQAKTLFSAGQYERSLALLRQVLARSPGNQEARQYAQMAENAIAGKNEETLRSGEALKTLGLARAAFEQGDFEEALRRADETLALDGGQVEAQKLRAESEGKIAESRLAAEAARKKKSKEQIASRRPSPARAPGRGADPTTAPVAGPPAPAPVNPSAPASLRLLFDSPLSEGHVMVAVNDQILLRRQFSFKRKEGLFKTVKETGTVSATLPVPPGAVTIKAWLSGPGISPAFASTNAQLAGGDNRTLRLEYSSGGGLSIQLR